MLLSRQHVIRDSCMVAALHAGTKLTSSYLGAGGAGAKGGEGGLGGGDGGLGGEGGAGGGLGGCRNCGSNSG